MNDRGDHSAPLRFCFGLHLHQPVGNFGHVFEQHVREVYLPFLQRLEQRAFFPVALHVSGPLIEWLEANDTRYLDLFPQDVQREIRTLLALSLRAVISQRLLPGTVAGTKRHLALEILWNTSPIAVAIRNGKIESIDNYLLTNRDDGMLSFDESVRSLLKAGKITRQVAEHNVRELAVLNR